MENKFSNIKGRILHYLDFKKVTKSKIIEELGMTYGSFKGSNKEKPINSDFLDKLLTNFPELNPKWLVTGKGAMEIQASKTNVLNEPAVNYKASSNRTPLVKVEAVAGFGSSEWAIEAKDIQDHYVVPDFNGLDFMIRVKGESMQPKYNSGDIVGCRIIRESKFIVWNNPYVIGTREQGIMVKRILPGSSDESIKAISDNPDYPPFEIPRDEITGVALIIGVIRLE